MRPLTFPLVPVALVALTSMPLTGQGADDGDRLARTEIDTLALASHARLLADDLLEGRAPASRGERLAALYLVSRLRALDLAPLPGREYRLPVPLTAVDFREEEAIVQIGGAGGTHTLRPPEFYHPGGARAAFRAFAGELLFMGPARDALDALEPHGNLSGRVVVLTPPWPGIHAVEAELVQRGAAGAVSLIPDGDFFDRLRVVRGPTRYHLPDEVRDPANQSRLPRVVGGPAMIRALGLDTAAGPGPGDGRARPLDRRIEVEMPHTSRERTGYNVAAHLPGADPALEDEWIVYVAHYDHVGHGEPTAGDSIWNGFVDNAVGSAMLLEIARSMAAEPPSRSVAFLWVTAEEQGLLGSNWFVHEPPLPLDRIRAVINVDGGAPVAPPTEWGLVGADQSAAGEIARRVVEDRGWTVDAREIGPQSDHWPFARAGVPAIMLFPGAEHEGMSEEEVAARAERWLHPHTPDDEWSEGFPLAGLRRYAELALEIGRVLATSE